MNENQRNTINSMLGLWETRLKNGESTRDKFVVWVQSMARKFPSSEKEIRNMIMGHPFLMDNLGGTVPSAPSKRPLRRKGCCG